MFLNEGHKKDNTVQQGNASQILSRFDIESPDQHALFILQKAEKITAALYLITDLIKNEEPYKWRIRDAALYFLSATHNIRRFQTASQKTNAISDALPHLTEVLSLLRLGVSVRCISQMNYAVLRDEYTSLHETLEDRLKMRQPTDGLILPQDFFELQNNKSITKQNIHVEGQIQRQNLNIVEENEEKEKEIKSVIENRQEKTSSEQKNNFIQDRVENKKEARQDTIVNFLRAHGAASIKDITSLVSGCSEKTIQRELSSLVNRGIVRKTGERRWSKYAVITSN